MGIQRVADKKQMWRSSFSDVIASGADPMDWTQIGLIGPGQSISQGGGVLSMVGGVTIGAETILRSKKAFRGNLVLRYLLSMTNRSANSGFFIELVDIIGDDLQFVINSTTSITVTIPPTDKGPRFTDANVGQSVYLGNFIGSVGISGRYAIASVVGNDVTFTVINFPASGTGTCSVFGWNYHRVLYDGTIVTNAKFDSQKDGWATGDTTAVINTTASPGHVATYGVEDGITSFYDQLAASSTTSQISFRGSRAANTPAFGTPLFLQIRIANGAAAPSNLTANLDFVSVEEYQAEPVQFQRSGLLNAPLPVFIQNAAGLTSAPVQGSAVRSSTTVGNPLYVATGYSANPSAIQTGRNVDLQATLIGALITKPFAIPEADWTFVGAVGGIVNTTTATTIKAAPGAGIRNYLTSLQIATDTLGAATELAIRDGAAGPVLWRGKLQTTALPQMTIDFPTPLKGAVNNLLEIVTLTASVTGGVYVNAQGYAAP